MNQEKVASNNTSPDRKERKYKKKLEKTALVLELLQTDCPYA
jgi:hypothetical protein